MLSLVSPTCNMRRFVALQVERTSATRTTWLLGRTLSTTSLFTNSNRNLTLPLFRMTTQQNLNEITCGCTPEELKLFLMAIYPPQLRISEHNVAPILMSACKMESPGLMRRCANLILNPLAQLSAFAKLSLLDRCFLHELLGERLLLIFHV